MLSLSQILRRFFTEQKKKRSELFALALLAVVCLFLSNHLWNGDVLFHTDLARDFLVLDDIVQTGKITLIGPRSGGIPGVFHGPLWYYISLIPFILTKGSPVLMGWFWWGWAAAATFAFFFLVRYITRHTTASFFAAVCFALLLVPGSSSAVNNYLADLFAFVVFFLWWKWFQKPSFVLAILGWLSLGILVQFQMAFAVPIAIVWFPFFAYRVVTKKLWKQFLSPFFFLPPLASFVLFDLRHDWLQVRSVLAYVRDSSSETVFVQRAVSRLVSAFRDGLNVFALPGFLSSAVVGILGFLGWKKKDSQIRSFLMLFFIWYICWWATTLVFSGTVWGYYYSPFFGIILFGVALIAARSRLALFLLGAVSIVFLLRSQKILLYSPERFDSSSWRLLSQIATDSLAEPERGYFLYSQDQYTYSLKYAFLWQERRQPEKPAYAFTKKPQTVVVKAADDPNNPYLNSTVWQEQRINLQQQPDSVRLYPFGYQVEYYTLDDEAVAVPIDPNLILDLHFR